MALKLEKQLKKLFKAATSTRNVKKIADKSADIIFKRTKAGFGVTRNKRQKKRLQRLSAQYIKQRRGLVEFTTSGGKKVKFRVTPKKLGSFAAARKSNLTLSGLMLDSMRTKARRAKFRIDIKPSSRPDSKFNNRQLAELVSKDRPFLALTDGEKRIILNAYREIINKLAKKIFK